MYCSNCGMQLPDGAKFCSGCGAQQGTARTNTYAAPQNQTGPQKKTGGLWKTIAVGIVCVLFVSMMSALGGSLGSKLPDVDNDGIISEEYKAVYAPYQFFYPLAYFADSASAQYAKDLGGLVDNLEIAYQDGVVTALCEKMYVDVSGVDETTKSLLHESMMTSFTPYDVLSNCTVQYELGSHTYTYTIVATDLDEEAKLQQCIRLGLLGVEGSASETKRLGIKKTEENLLSQGYSKR